MIIVRSHEFAAKPLAHDPISHHAEPSTFMSMAPGCYGQQCCLRTCFGVSCIGLPGLGSSGHMQFPMVTAHDRHAELMSPTGEQAGEGTSLVNDVHVSQQRPPW